ncbi:hypothetical protein [Jiangella rhizosphaerae]|uniref:Uncharacterized protein n=1 Tax=Jiangella rhizosphaerae TaxID=2293569 RepID=A0A418KP75_9ACTN|nr:hypothetical protein [Jiangella rhizosphaerae]RIQ21087.1 hypothetical protein DY240_16200 [Jiangella rhizosphaerae]
MAGRTWTLVGRALAGVVLGLVVLVAAGIAIVWWQWQQAEQEVLDDQATQAEIVRGKLERLRDRGPLLEADVAEVVDRAENGTLYSMTERRDDTYIVASVGALGGPAISVQSGPDYACYGFTVPASSEPVTVERLSPEEGRWPEECRSD